MTRLSFQIDADSHKKRLDHTLFGRFTDLSKMYLRDLVRDEKCEVNGRNENIGYKLRMNDFVEIELDLSRETAMRPEDIPLDIIFEDEAIIIVNKPSGMLVHPTHRDKNGTLLNALSFYLNRRRGEGETGRKGEKEAKDLSWDVSSSPPLLVSPSSFIRPGLVHRLDKETSGLLVVAKTDRAHRILADHFKRKLIEKRYLALVEGIVAENEGTIEAPIGRFAEQKLWNVKADGKHAETRYLVRGRHADTTLLELEPVTGRTNQLRIHCASIGHPIVGDTARGGREFTRLCLHAFRLAFRHPRGGEMIEFISEMPPDWS